MLCFRDWGRKDSDDWGKGWGDDGGWSGETSPDKSPNKEVKPKKASTRVGSSDKGKSGSKAKMEGELLIDFDGSKQEKKDDGWGNSWDDEAWESLNK